MKTNLFSVVSLAIGVFSCQMALAKPKPTPTPPVDISMSVPQSQLTLPKEDVVESKASSNFVRLQFSNWSAPRLSEPTQLNDTTGFSSNSPDLGLQLGSKLREFSWATMSSVIGGSYTEMQRSGDLGIQTASLQLSQNLRIYQASFGLELLGTRELLTNLRPFGSLSVGPAIVQSVSSEFNDGVNEVDWLATTSVGLSWNSVKTAKFMGVQEAALELGVENTLGLNTSQMSGNAVWAGARLGWK